MSLENYFVVRKNPKGGFSYVEGHEFDPRNEGSNVFIDISVSDISKVYATFDECMNAALEENAEHGVVTHPECEVEQALRDITEFIETTDYWDDEGVQIKKDGVIIRQPKVDVVIRAAEITE